ncbi:MAG: TonB-dependent receptor [Bacteroidales bacterium]|nr:TonB-dependent receptor [Bacteroidales bacterium]
MINKQFNIFIFFLLLITVQFGYSQKAEIYGKVTDEDKKPFDPPANILIYGTSNGTTTKADGSYALQLDPGISILVRFSFTGYKPVDKIISLKPGQKKEINIIISERYDFDTVEIVGRREYDGLIRIDKKKLELIPTPSGDFVTEFLKRMPGVNSNNELSTQYSVRGGNFDENLVYVNGIEIHRPVLIRSGQQEGLPFVNSDLVDNITFSAGGFSANYGDKMSSVLDITYRKPKEFGGSIRGSLMGGAVAVEGASKSIPFQYLIGLRYKTNSYLLSSLDTKGDYRPRFIDFQSLFTYNLNEFWQIDLLSSLSMNKYHLIPADRETNFGSIYEALRFTVYFEGQEVDEFNTYMGSLKLTRTKRNHTNWLAFTLHRTMETESFDILGQYWLSVLENDLGKDDFGEVAYNKGIGSFLNHGRNQLDGWITNLKYQGEYKKNFQYGVEFRHDLLNDKLSEWQLIDSSGFSLPHPPDNIGNTNPNYIRPNTIELQEVVRAKNYNFATNKISAFVQKKWNKEFNKNEIAFELGIRSTYWDFSEEFLISPRFSVNLNPKWKRDIALRLATGIFSQPGFFREMRYFDGTISPNVKAQKSWQVIAGADYNFDMWDRPFRLTIEAYYKYFWDLIPYEIDDVRIRYFANNDAVGYATGLDLKLNGEFVELAESWVGVSFLKTQEDIIGDFYYELYNKSGEKIIPGITTDNVPSDSLLVEPGFIPRPTDQRISFNLFFQDYVPNYPTYKVHLNLVFATGLPFGPPTHKRYQQTDRYPPYRRVDIGFSKQLIGEDSKLKSKNPLRFFKSMWISVEVFNLLQISNTLSYLWIMDVEGRMNPVPNFLTPRRLNVQLSAKF